MIELYTAKTPNGWKASICLEELELPYTVKHLDFDKLEQKEDWYLEINPNGRIPAIIDRENNGFKVFESGAILIYLAENAGRLLPTDRDKRSITMQGQALVFKRNVEEKIPVAIDRYMNETKRLYNVLDKRLEAAEFLAGDDYSIGGITLWPWIYCSEWTGIDLGETPNLARWFDTVSSRPAVKKGLNVPEPFDINALMKDDAKIKEVEKKYRKLI
jgi:GST-like protein